MTTSFNLVSSSVGGAIIFASPPGYTFVATFNYNLTHTITFWPGYGKTVTGTVTEGGVPVAKLVRVYDSASGILITETTSDPVTGQYKFIGIGSPLVDVVAKDPPNYRAQIYDGVVPT